MGSGLTAASSCSAQEVKKKKKKEKETSLDYYQVFLRRSLVLSTLTSEKPLRAKCLENILSGGGIDTKLAPFNTEYRFFFFFSFLPNLLLIYGDQQKIGRI